MKRIYHPYWDWECYHAGFFKPLELNLKDVNTLKYCEFLGDTYLFEKYLQAVLKQWPISCEQFLSNSSTNRIAWLGQASMCLYSGISSAYRSGFKLLPEDKQNKANQLAKKYLDRWLDENKNK